MIFLYWIPVPTSRIFINLLLSDESYTAGKLRINGNNK